MIADQQALVSDADAARLPFQCDGPVMRAPDVLFDNIEDVVTPYHCVSGSRSGYVRLADARGELVDFDVLRRKDALGFAEFGVAWSSEG